MLGSEFKLRFSRFFSVSFIFHSLVSLSILASGCSWLQDQRKPKLSFQKGALNLSCLQSTTPALQDLFQGNLTDSPEDTEKAKSIWKCLDRTLEVFSKYTTGKNHGYYEARELQSFAIIF